MLKMHLKERGKIRAQVPQMSVINLKCSTDVKQADIQFLPCEIDHDELANVSKYFIIDSELENKSDTTKKTSFRGRLLAGDVVNIPKGYKGVIVKEIGKNYSDEQERTICVEKSFDRFNYWNLEIPPNKDDALMRAFDWLDVAHVIHEPITNENDHGKDAPTKR